MQTLKLSQVLNSEPALTDGYSDKDDDLSDRSPKPQYFQVHFQHIHENIHQLQDELVQLKDAVAHLDEKLERLLAVLNSPPNPVL
jgi:Mg2+ and Co2+ transporter CorA